MAEPSYTYDPASHRYRNTETGRYVSQVQVRRVLDATIVSARDEMGRLGEQLAARKITVQEWQRQMAENVKAMHVGAAVLAKGGFERMTPADWGRVGAQLRRQYGYLQRFADDVAIGKQSLNGAPYRSEMYAESARNTYEAARRVVMQEAGYQAERNERGAADSCDGCLEATDAGVVPIGTLSLPGERECHANCHCTIVYTTDIGA